MSYGNDILQNQSNKKSPALLVFIVIILIAIIGYLYWMYDNLKKESIIKQKELEQRYEIEKNKLVTELNQLWLDFDSLKTDNDSMNYLLQVQKDRIKQLLTVNISNREKIKLYKNELGTLREIMKSYIIQIDSLNQKNLQLTAENVQVRRQLKSIQQSKRKLEDEKEELTSKVEIASILNAKNIVVSPLNKRSKEKVRIGKIDKIRTCFLIRENNVVPAGPKDIYLRIVRPDDLVLANSKAALFEYQGDHIVYTAMRQLEYDNQDIEICIYYDVQEGDLVPGNYEIYIFESQNQIGSTTFALK